MEDLEYKLNEGIELSDNKNRIFLSISILSWLAFLVTSWLSLGLPYTWKLGKIFWVTMSINYEKKELKELDYKYLPITIFYEFHYTVFILTFIFATIGFLIFMLFKENENITNLMLGKFTKFHFIPLLCISALFIIGESRDIFDDMFSISEKDPDYFSYKYKVVDEDDYDSDDYDSDDNEESEDYDYPNDIEDYDDDDNVYLINESRYILNFVFTILGLASLIYIYITTKTKSPWYAYLAINKGTYSCLISLLVYNFFYSITYYVLFKLIKKDKEIDDWMKASGIIFSLVIGIVNSILSIVLKDIMISFMNILIYTGMLIYYFKIERKERENYNEFADGIIDIVILVGNVAIIVFLSFQWKKIYTEE